VDPVSDSVLVRKSGSAGNRTRTSASVARNSEHQTTEAVAKWILFHKIGLLVRVADQDVGEWEILRWILVSIEWYGLN
jgi:hypothetical protein